MKSRKAGVALCVTVFMVAALLLFPVSFGPAVWFTARGCFHRATIERLYWPVLWSAVYGPDLVSDAVHFWGSLGVSSEDAMILQLERENGALIELPFRNENDRSIIPKLFRFKSRTASKPRYGGVI